MAIVTRYFSTASAGDGLGLDWDNRAQLHDAGTWSTVLAGFNFSGSDSLKCLIGPGTHAITTNALSAGLFANPPTLANPLVLHGCDSSGVALAVPDAGWVSAEAAWDDSTLPVLETTTNIRTFNATLHTVFGRLLKITASGCNQTVSTNVHLDWCTVTNSTSNASASAQNTGSLTNCVCQCTGSAYGAVGAANSVAHFNTRFQGVAGATGNRHGVLIDATTFSGLNQCTIVGCGGNGVNYSSGGAGQSGIICECTIANNGGGIVLNSTASQTANWTIRNNCITGNGAYGVDASAARVFCANNRLRDNTSPNHTNFGNHPTDLDYITDSDDATEFVNAGAGDYRIKNTALIWGKGYGAGDEPAAGGGASGGFIIGS